MHHPIAPMRSLFTLGRGGEELKGRAQVAPGAVFRQTTRQFMGHLRVLGDLAAIETDGQRDISLAGEFRRLLFHPVAEPPPFVNDDDRGKGAVSPGSVENTLHRFIAALIGNRPAVGGERTEDSPHHQCTNATRKAFMESPL